jgi:hypothetical protein
VSEVVSHVPHLPPSEPDRNGLFDRLGIGVSMTCAVHCVLSSLVALAPAVGLGGAEGSGLLGLGNAMEWLELPLLVGALGIGLWALVPGYLRDHRKPLAIRLFLVGIGLIFLSRIVVSPFETSPIETGLTVLGVIFVASAHIANLRAHAELHRTQSAHTH